MLGHVGDKDGIKMSKHKGNVVDPWDALNAQGADAVRWYFYTGSSPWLPSRFSLEAVSEAQRKFMGTLWNTYAFYVLYAEIDQFNPYEYKLEYDKLSLMDKWILSKLNSLIDFVDKSLENYVITEPARAMAEFTDELSNWYVRRCRERYWGSEMTQDKISAYMTLYTVLCTLAKLSAPFTPFMAEAIYQNLVRGLNKNEPESVHLCAFPVSDRAYIDKALEENMEMVLSVVVLGRACRSSAGIKNRQPLSRIYVKSERALPEQLNELIADELNVKTVEYLKDDSRFTSYSLKPQMRTLGPKYGRLLGGIGKYLAQADSNAIVETVRKGGVYSFELSGAVIELKESDLLITAVSREGYVSESDGGIVVVLDTALNEELIAEGYVRELVSKIQNARKEQGLEVTDHIELILDAQGALRDAVEKHSRELCGDVLCDKLVFGHSQGRELDINGSCCVAEIKKL